MLLRSAAVPARIHLNCIVQAEAAIEGGGASILKAAISDSAEERDDGAGSAENPRKASAAP